MPLNKTNHGYLIPDNAQPDHLRCVRVYLPDDPLYLAALLGSLTYLGTWAAWERDAEKRGRLAALAWKDANERTIDELPLGCEGECEDCELCDMTQDELREIISQELENMSIVINNHNCGCGCGCGCGGSTTGAADLTPQTDPIISPDDYEPPENTPPQIEDDAQKCAIANYFVHVLEQTMLNSISFSGNETEHNGFWHTLWAGVKDNVEGWLESFDYFNFTWLMNVLNGNASMENIIRDYFETNGDYLVCQLFQATNEANAYERLHVALRSTTQHNEQLWQSAAGMAGVMPFQLLFQDPGTVSIPVGFENSQCCGGDYTVTAELPQPAEGFKWVVPDSFVETLGPDIPIVYLHTEDTVDFTGTIDDSDQTFSANVICNRPSLQPGETIEGFAYLVNINDCVGGESPDEGDFARINGITHIPDGLFSKLTVRADYVSMFECLR